MGDELATRTAKAAEGFLRRRPLPALGLQPADRAPLHPLLALQQAIGNRAVQRLIRECPAFPGCCSTGGACHTCPARVQAKLTISQPGDRYEQEADRVAEQVMRMPEPRLQRQAGQITPLARRQVEAEEEKEEPIRAKTFSVGPSIAQMQKEAEEEPLQARGASVRTPVIDGSLESQVEAIRGCGQPLPDPVRDFFEPRFGYDFSQVKAHTGPEAARAAKTANARAFTVGRDLVFGEGEYAPETNTGKSLLAHELTHVVQQGPVVATRTKPGIIQRELAAYKTGSTTRSTYKTREGDYEHITTLTGDAATIMSMLQALIDAKKVGVIDSGDSLRFFNRGASSTEIEEALKTHPKGKDLAKYLMDNNNTYFYSKERVFQQNTPFGSFADRTSDYSAQSTTRTRTIYNARLHMESGRFVGNVPGAANNLREEVLQAMDRLIELGAYTTSVDYFGERNTVSALAAGSNVPAATIPGAIAAIHRNEAMTLDRSAAAYLGLTLSAGVGQGQTNNKADIYKLQDLLHINWQITNSDYNTERAAVDALTAATVPDAAIPKTIEGIKKIRVSYAAGTLSPQFLRQLSASAEAGRMVGGAMTWRPSGPGSGTDFEQWASAATAGPAPALASGTVMNCWEMVLLSAYRAGMATWQWIHDTYTAGPAVPAWFTWLPGRMTRGARITYTVGDRNSPAPQRGQIVFFNGAAHVAIAEGARDGSGRSLVISFWPPPGAASIPGTSDKIKITTIEELVDYMTGSMGMASVAVTFASPAW